MKIVIDIPENIFKKIDQHNVYPEDVDVICNAVLSCTPLPDARFVNISDMMYEIYMEGVNMTGEYQGCWVRFKDIENVVNKHIPERR